MAAAREGKLEAVSYTHLDVYKRQVMMVKMPYRAEYTTCSGKHRNMKPNSKGSVTPQTNAQIAAETTRPKIGRAHV